MPDLDICLPEGWSHRSEITPDDRVFAAFDHQPTGDTTFLLSIESPSAEPGYVLRLSTLSEAGTHPRHDYDIARYDSHESALNGAERIMDELGSRLDSGSISESAPSIEDVHDLLDAFGEERRTSKLGQLFDYFR